MSGYGRNCPLLLLENLEQIQPTEPNFKCKYKDVLSGKTSCNKNVLSILSIDYMYFKCELSVVINNSDICWNNGE